MKTIHKSIDIAASAEKVWEVLASDTQTKVWYAVFSEGTHADTDWQEGSKIIATDNTGEGLVGMIKESKPGEILSIEYYGWIKEGKEDTESKVAQMMKGAKEIYRLSEKGGATHLDISCDMDEGSYEMMSESWNKAVVMIKDLAEKV
ncbi:SRPBCC domain-containing protein [soil metagenome]